MRRIWSLAAAGLLATGALAACGESTEPAAVVNGIEISQQDVVDELDAIRGNEGYVEAYDSSAVQSGLPGVAGTTEDTFNRAFVTSTLSTRILYAIVHAAVEERGIEIDDECRDQAAQQAAQQLAGADPNGDGQAVLDAFGADYKDYLIDRAADVLALQADLADQQCVDPDAARNYYDEHRDEFDTEVACASHILVDTQEQADDLKAQLDAGADFATLAQQSSTDTGSAAQGGSLGCNPQGTFVPEFDDVVFSAPLNQVVGPVQTEFGYHLVLVTERGIGDFEDVEAQVNQVLAQQVNAAFGEWFDTAVTDADVVVDERYGTWDPEQRAVRSPDEPAEPDTTDTTGDTVPPASDG